MMSDGRDVLREVAWREVFPWLLIFRCFRLAIHPAILAAALVAGLLTSLGWRGAYVVVFMKDVPTPAKLVTESTADIRLPEPVEGADAQQRAAQVAANDTRVQAGRDRSAFALEQSRMLGVRRSHDAKITERLARPWDALTTKSPLGYVYSRFAEPFLQMYRTSTDLRGFTFYLLGTLWTLAVWGFGGGVITRIAAIELGREEQARMRSVLRVTGRRWFDFFTAPLYPVLGTFLIALLTMPVGWILSSSDAGSVVAGLLWIFVLIGGALSALLMLWLLIGWPLMWPAISAEETGDSFEAMSRSFAYAFQRPLHYLFYAAVASLLGYVCWSVVDFGCVLTLEATHWAVSWGAGHERVVEAANFPPADDSGRTALRVGSTMIRGVEGLLLALSEAFAYSYFWVAATAIYLLLRQNLDRTEFDDVWLEDEADRYGVSQEIVVPPEQPVAVTGPQPPAPVESDQAE
jgi:hypothetical protein